MKILFVGDIHFRASKPISRLDGNFLATQLGKLDEVREIADDENVDIVILAGDVYDRPDVPHSVVIRTIRAFKKFRQKVYSIAGNHDIFAYTSSTEDSSAIGVLFESGAVRKLSVLETPGVTLYPMHAYDDTRWTVPEDNSRVKILVAHKMLTNISIPGADCLLIKNVDKETNADIILSGDIHTPHLEHTAAGHWFVNPGSMTRMSIADRDRQPQVAIISAAAGQVTECEFRSLGIRPAETVFDLKNYSERMAQETHAKDFVKTYVQTIVSIKAEAGDVGNAIIAMLEANSFADDVRAKIKAYLDRTHKEVLVETEE